MSGKIDWQGVLFSWNGRLRRSHFWIGMVAIGIANMVGGAIPIVGFLVSLALIAPAASLCARRLHDMGRSARLALIPVAASVVALLLGTLATATATAAFGGIGAFGLLAFAGPVVLLVSLLLLVNLAFVLWVGLSAGVQGANAYGADPR